MKKSILVGLFASLLLSVSAQAADKLKMGVVVKIGGIPLVQRHGGRHQKRGRQTRYRCPGWSGRRRRIRRCRCAPSKI